MSLQMLISKIGLLEPIMRAAEAFKSRAGQRKSSFDQVTTAGVQLGDSAAIQHKHSC